MEGRSLADHIAANVKAALFDDGQSLSRWAKAIAPFVLERLAGHKVEIRWERPRAITTTGKTEAIARRRGDLGIIQIDPNLNPSRAYHDLLHEAAHLRLHWPTLPDELQPAHRPAVVGRRTMAAYKADAREPQAEAQTRIWERWAEARAQGDDVADRLVALLTWRAP